MTTADTPNVQASITSRLTELRSSMANVEGELASLTDKPVLEAAEEERYADLWAERDSILPELTKLEERAARGDEIRARKTRELSGVPNFQRPVSDFDTMDVTRSDKRHVRDAALRILGDSEQSFHLRSNQGDVLDTLARKDPDAAARIVVTENDAYRSAFHKAMTDPTPVFTAEEHHAILRYKDYQKTFERAASTTVGSGGYAIPVFIDPSFILTDQETDNPFLRLCRVVDVNSGSWKGVSGAGLSWSFDTEASAVSDDSNTSITQPSVTVYTARGYVPYSIEIGEDWPGFQSEMARLLAAGYDELLIQKFTVGNGTTEPRGLITALDANSAVRIKATTAGAFGNEDVYKLYKNVPQKWRRNMSWMSSIDINNRIAQMGTATQWHAVTNQLPDPAVDRLRNSAYYENSYMADFTSTTTLSANLLVAGDFSNYVIARRRGMQVEFVPVLFDQATGRPSGQRGWFATARIGGNSVNDTGFRLLVNTNGT